MKILIKNGKVIDPGKKSEGWFDILIHNHLIEKIGPHLEDEADQIIDASDCYVMPGLIDLHVHLREPGFTHKETIETGAKAAARGGFTTICAMPNTNPVVDSKEGVEWVHNKAKEVSGIHVLQIGAITKKQEGTILADIKGMASAGAPAISEDGKSVMNVRLYKEGMREAAKCNIPVFAHCEDKELVGKGVINEGKKSEEFKLPGISNGVEDIIVARDIILAKETGVRLHLCHCSTKDSVAMVKLAKEAGISVTAEVCPHHFALSEDDMKEIDTNYKMNPPLRTKEDVEALKEGLKSGIIDAIATDHAPHHEEEKQRTMDTAPFGIVGLETAVALTVTELLDKGYLTPLGMADRMSYRPAKILGIDKGTLQEGDVADLVIINPKMEYVIDKKEFTSMGRNMPYQGRKVKGKVIMTIAEGKVVYSQEVDR